MNRLLGALPVLAFLLIFSLSTGALAAGLPAAPPAQLGFSPERLKRIDALMQRYTEQQKLAGMTIAIARDGKLAYLHSEGMADIAAGRPIRQDTIFRFYSMSKPITAVAALQLVEQGKLRLDDALAEHLPEFRDVKVYAGENADGSMKLEAPAKPIRIRDLFTHTSGFTYAGMFDQTPVGAAYETADIMRADRTLQEFSKVIAGLPLTIQPQTTYNYGVSTDILGRVIEVVSGEPFDAYLRAHVFEPLGMADTAFTVPADKLERFAEIYEAKPGGGLQPVADDEVRTRFRADAGARLNSGGGGLTSTVGDYLRFSQMLLNGGELDGVRILGPKTVALMTAPALPMDRMGAMAAFMPGYTTGLGVAVLVDLGRSELPGSVGEFNWAGAASTYFFIDPKEKLIAILLTQHFPPTQYPLREELKAITYQALVEARDVD
ncbi:serine hydrolase domain-containing protein [Emcibacter sp. SYSU 3D8]|uniref:serine hydrolase domain-containing protein n=1 Tax=Emcibacter sp. SYSU 3D8 TaxID=3133969 RepID=UPI0031FF2EF4